MSDDSVKRGRESSETWAKRVKRWRDSGLTSGEFCAEADLNPRTLIYWAWRLRKESGLPPEKSERKVRKPKVAPTTAASKQPRAKKATPSPKFVELMSPLPSSSHEPIEIVVRSITVRVPQTAAADLVGRAFEFAEKQK